MSEEALVTPASFGQFRLLFGASDVVNYFATLVAVVALFLHCHHVGHKPAAAPARW